MLQDQRICDHEQQRDRQLACVKQCALRVSMKKRRHDGPGAVAQLNGARDLTHRRSREAARLFFCQGPHILVNEGRNEECVNRRDGSRFGWCEYAAVDAAKDDDDQEEAPASLTARGNDLAPALPLTLGQVLDFGDYIDGGHEHETGQQSWNDPSQEHPTDRDLHRRCINDHYNGRRDQDAQCPCGTNDACGKVFGITHLTHAADDDRSDRHNRCRGRP